MNILTATKLSTVFNADVVARRRVVLGLVDNTVESSSRDKHIQLEREYHGRRTTPETKTQLGHP